MRLLALLAVGVLGGCVSVQKQDGMPLRAVCEVHGAPMTFEAVEIRKNIPKGDMASYVDAKKREFPHHGGVRYFPLELKADALVCQSCTAGFRRWLNAQAQVPNTAPSLR